MRRVLVTAVLLVLLALAPAGSSAQGVPLTCPLALTRLEPTTTNALLLDTHTVYWVVPYQGLPGTRIRVTGEYPHARYISFNAYDPEARPADALSDTAIAPAPGSTNPFQAGASRNAPARTYTLYVEFGPRPSAPAPNTIYTGSAADGSPNYVGSLWYRVYLPDRGRDLTGGVGLPQVALESSAGGGTLGTSACSQTALPTANAVNQAIADSNGAPVPVIGNPYPGRNPPRWRLYTSFGESIQDILLDNQQGDAVGGPHPPPGGPALGFFSNKDNAYVSAPTSRGFGDLIVIHGRLPTFPDTRPPAAVMPGGKQVRYFSLCQYDPLSQRVIDCRSDDELPVDSSGNYTAVVSTPASRPSNAQTRCGVAWIAWGPQPQGLLIARQVLADPGFSQSIAHVGAPGNEQRVMGSYYPSATYVASKSAFEARGCVAATARPRSQRARRRAARPRSRPRAKRSRPRPRFTG